MKIKIYETIKGIFKRYRDYNGNDIDYENAKIILKNDNTSVLIDVRSPQEYKEGYLNGAINIPLYELEECCDCKLKDKEKITIVYCQSGIRSKKAVNILKKNGFKNLYHLKGGLDDI